VRASHDESERVSALELLAQVVEAEEGRRGVAELPQLFKELVVVIAQKLLNIFSQMSNVKELS
jgi:hypothetical protein